MNDEDTNVSQAIYSPELIINEGNNSDDSRDSSYNEETQLLDSAEHELMPTWKAAVNFICDVEGTGLLGLPYAVLNGGVAALAASGLLSP